MKRVRVCLGVVLACSLLDAGAALGQRAAEVQQSLDSTVKGQQLLIRDFVADRVIHYAWAVDHLEHQPTRMFTFGVFVADSIKVHESRGVADEVRIEGKRWVLRKVDPSAPDGLTDQSSKVIFDVDLRGADAATISGLKAVLFFPDVDAALGAVPPQFVRLIGLRKPGVNMSGGWKPGRWLKVEGKWQLVQGPVPNPRVRQTAEPQFSEEARSKKIGGNVMILIAYNAEETVDAVWLLRPLGYGLDEKAMEVGLKYQIDQEWEGQPVGSVLAVSVNFQIF